MTLQPALIFYFRPSPPAEYFLLEAGTFGREGTGEPPLVVDLDGTLVKSDMLVEIILRPDGIAAGACAWRRACADARQGGVQAAHCRRCGVRCEAAAGQRAAARSHSRGEGERTQDLPGLGRGSPPRRGGRGRAGRNSTASSLPTGGPISPGRPRPKPCVPRSARAASIMPATDMSISPSGRRRGTCWW